MHRQATVPDTLTAEALDLIYQWFRRELDDLCGYSEDQPRRRRSNKPLVIDQGGFVEAARGWFWDLTTDPPSLMRRHLSGTPRLNAAAVLAAVGADPDKELLNGIKHGVRMPTAHQMLIVLNPGLLSLAGYLGPFVADIGRMEADGMLKVCRFLPYVRASFCPRAQSARRTRRTSAG
jgi:hypothetical protein